MTPTWEELYTTYNGPINRYLSERLGRNHPDIADLSQQVWLRVWRHLAGWTYQGKPIRAWIYAIARNLVIDHQRNRAYRSIEREIPPGEIGVPSYEFESSVATRSELEHVLAQLQDEDVDWIRLAYVERITLSDLAKELGTTRVAVKAYGHRVARRVRTRLGIPLTSPHHRPRRDTTRCVPASPAAVESPLLAEDPGVRPGSSDSNSDAGVDQAEAEARRSTRDDWSARSDSATPETPEGGAARSGQPAHAGH